MTLTMGGKRKERAYSEHKPKWQRFQTSLMVHSSQSAASQQKKSKSTPSSSGNNNKPTLHPYQRQYAHVYHQRLAALKPRCWQAVDNDNDVGKDIVKVDRILDLRETVRSIVVGTLVKEGGNGEFLAHKDTTRCQASQSLFVEDESGRANLVVENVHDFTTGMVLGLLGAVGQHGQFQVERVFYPALPPHPSLPKSNPQDAPPVISLGNPHLLLISGLHCGDPSLAPAQRQMLLDYIRGSFESGDDDNSNTTSSSKISHVIIAGGSTVKHDEHPTVALKELDGFCLQLGAMMHVPVDILPGKEDPTTANWPQRPLHKSLLKFTDRKVPHLVSRVPNPYGALHATKFVLGTDGTNATDLAKSLLIKNEKKQQPETKTQDSSSTDESPKEEEETIEWEPVSHLEALRRTLQCGHICPTGPDTVPTMPHPQTDPMVLTETPHLYFAGNCDDFATDVMTMNQQQGDDKVECRLVCVPRFADTGVAVLVNLETMEAKSVRVMDPGV